MKAKANGFGLGVLAHGRGDALASGRFGDHVAAVADVVAEAGLVGFDVVGTEDLAVSFGDVGGLGIVNPVVDGVGLSAAGVVGIGVAWTDDREKNIANRIVISQLNVTNIKTHIPEP